MIAIFVTNFYKANENLSLRDHHFIKKNANLFKNSDILLITKSKMMGDIKHFMKLFE